MDVKELLKQIMELVAQERSVNWDNPRYSRASGCYHQHRGFDQLEVVKAVSPSSLILFFHDTINNIAKLLWLFRAAAGKPFFQYTDILMPFESGVFKKGDYTKWMDNIKSWQNEKIGERI